jgi:hypothetical protein
MGCSSKEGLQTLRCICWELLKFSAQGHLCLLHTSVTWVPCYHGIAHHQVVDGGDGPQLWKVAANVLNKEPQVADKGWSSSLGLISSHFQNVGYILWECVRSDGMQVTLNQQENTHFSREREMRIMN